MTNNFCAKCGAELVAGSRFCRRCGRASGAFDSGSVTEAETRVFDATAERGAQTQYYDQKPTGLDSRALSEAATPAASAGSQQPGQRKRSGIVWGSIVILLAIIALTVFAAIRITKNSTPTTPVATKPEIPVPPAAPQPPQPPQAPVAGTGSSSALDYPGADVTMEMTRGTGGSMRQLRTSDSFEKVVAWYTDKLKPAEKINTPDGPTAVLKGKEMTAIITGDEEGTEILLKGGLDK